MYILNPCRHSGCKKLAVSTFDENGNITEGPSYCLEHHPDPYAVKQRVLDYVKSHDKIIGLNMQGAIVDRKSVV